MSSINPSETNTSRRQVLCGLVVALAAPAGLAACSSGSESTQAPPAGGAAPGSAAPGGSAGSGGTPLSSIPVGSGVVVNGSSGPVVVTQPSAGTVKAFSAVCPHQGTTVNPPQGQTIRCPRHGSEFNPTTGAVQKGPAQRGLTEVPTRVVDGNVVLS